MDLKCNTGVLKADLGPGNVRAHVCDNGHRHLRRNRERGVKVSEGACGASSSAAAAEELPETAVIHCRPNDALAHASVLIAVATRLRIFLLSRCVRALRYVVVVQGACVLLSVYFVRDLVTWVRNTNIGQRGTKTKKA